MEEESHGNAGNEFHTDMNDRLRVCSNENLSKWTENITQG
jgi:hypothetical protein